MTSPQVVRFQDLQCLSLSLLPDITDASLTSIARHCRSLTSLAVSHCPGISDRGVAQAAPCLHRLQHLYLSCCNNITDRWVAAHNPTYCLPYAYPKINSKLLTLTPHRSLFLLARHCKRLKTLDVSRCNNVSVTTVDVLQSQLPFLENVHYKFMGGADLSHSYALTDWMSCVTVGSFL